MPDNLSKKSNISNLSKEELQVLRKEAVAEIRKARDKLEEFKGKPKPKDYNLQLAILKQDIVEKSTISLKYETALRRLERKENRVGEKHSEKKEDEKMQGSKTRTNLFFAKKPQNEQRMHSDKGITIGQRSTKNITIGSTEQRSTKKPSKP